MTISIYVHNCGCDNIEYITLNDIESIINNGFDIKNKRYIYYENQISSIINNLSLYSINSYCEVNIELLHLLSLSSKLLEEYTFYVSVYKNPNMSFETLLKHNNIILNADEIKTFIDKFIKMIKIPSTIYLTGIFNIVIVKKNMFNIDIVDTSSIISPIFINRIQILNISTQKTSFTLINLKMLFDVNPEQHSLKSTIEHYLDFSNNIVIVGDFNKFGIEHSELKCIKESDFNPRFSGMCVYHTKKFNMSSVTISFNKNITYEHHNRLIFTFNENKTNYNRFNKKQKIENTEYTKNTYQLLSLLYDDDYCDEDEYIDIDDKCVVTKTQTNKRKKKKNTLTQDNIILEKEEFKRKEILRDVIKVFNNILNKHLEKKGTIFYMMLIFVDIIEHIFNMKISSQKDTIYINGLITLFFEYELIPNRHSAFMYSLQMLNSLYANINHLDKYRTTLVLGIAWKNIQPYGKSILLNSFIDVVNLTYILSILIIPVECIDECEKPRIFNCVNNLISKYKYSKYNYVGFRSFAPIFTSLIYNFSISYNKIFKLLNIPTTSCPDILSDDNAVMKLLHSCTMLFQLDDIRGSKDIIPRNLINYVDTHLNEDSPNELILSLKNMYNQFFEDYQENYLDENFILCPFYQEYNLMSKFHKLYIVKRHNMSCYNYHIISIDGDCNKMINGNIVMDLGISKNVVTNDKKEIIYTDNTCYIYFNICESILKLEFPKMQSMLSTLYNHLNHIEHKPKSELYELVNKIINDKTLTKNASYTVLVTDKCYVFKKDRTLDYNGCVLFAMKMILLYLDGKYIIDNNDIDKIFKGMTNCSNY